MDIRYRVRGGNPLRGDITISGSKNAALPLIAASVLASGETVLHNVPRLRDITVMLRILEFLGAETSFQGNTVRIRTHKLQNRRIPVELVSKLRGSIVLLGPLLARFGTVEMAYPGGCVLGKRPVYAHIAALGQLGAKDRSTDEVLHLEGELKPGRVILPEFSVTATENAVMAAALVDGEIRIDLAAAEPHVQEVEKIVASMGAQVQGIGTHAVLIRGRKNLQSPTHTVIPDYLEAGAFIIAALVTKGKVRLHGADPEHLISFLSVLKRMGGIVRVEGDVLFVDGELSMLQAQEVRTNIFPGFPTDLQATMGVAMTQAKGVSRIFERLFEGRMAYLYELEKMGAHIEILNAHEALIIGPTELRGRVVSSNDIRAGAAMVLASLCARGETMVTDVRYIERGYDRFDEKLKSLGADIEKISVEERKEEEGETAAPRPAPLTVAG
ncbi:MAG TPA: UDP-N-acetylglucosamine 1-carboxyvinyltransferase [Candidatus Peribacter riflensis]|uniref:UDP-N-acetylglucosamine 1-carboxyvinyltransferase n=1 Tax=Candidatus Peribacter riflensis TaxID=1735162 RepID=A0A0S1SIH9_9BACT|nr:MAG: UDP-N-acetylglucosamine 1-carboxyvinyltransferase [Candidatus Peribacter riflensis]OGJ77974.1 MAG: UDP-N-acetylglucosamine 1-carboxyvinyltransferase [Candidatus Peribacteria bacterium RIFOXYB1_FULL_57_12]ALM11512.1 MAG: UDP-N-acetylglucosamine 1-carboxyvinyltransferase [Candidatus Peribacter riflensis]ALM12614.1 MAG: UDP-N-acetylglucosamine 1-carboxyvinyltransferase [Candidatus Peribacter riflensis]ALM13715.1 MAG: UDP-N-acetylglucosamine 1-carboxyvinyltransferase [Candidatus Peribacter 